MKYFIVVLLNLFILTNVFAFDNKCSTEKIKDINREFFSLSTTIADINTYTVGKGTYPTDVYKPKSRQFIVGSSKLRGSGFVLDNNVVVTARHVVMPDTIQVIESEYSSILTEMISELEKVIFVGDEDSGSLGASAKIIYENPDYDVAILSADNPNSLQAISFAQPVWTYGIQNNMFFDFLNAGDCIFTVVKQRDEEGDKGSWYEIRTGKVVSSTPLGQTITSGFNQMTFLFDMEVFPGDSGSPIFAFDKETPVIIGIIQGKLVDTTLNYGMRIDVVLNKIYALQNFNKAKK